MLYVGEFSAKYSKWLYKHYNELWAVLTELYINHNEDNYISNDSSYNAGPATKSNNNNKNNGKIAKKSNKPKTIKKATILHSLIFVLNDIVLRDI